ncbi:hypothetical protein ZOD2009_15431 [Haladaptatus paucihalophilus DX253]|uniref:Uncharacterized protein n=1 Tax=Haladaptatus paucihalophilus DX253 TaxID=797209 RepID=E7QW98_HALPU|nr:hypothetical protein [Haladaptatus paucihalophilus]EFW91232.1 hypothetical protein ZOD2009_15431 [Haladaptatus paucihalophilus DX253]SHL66266.1 hypothetical protein SAMN05444342_4358 [Haladaptatus paucihalophilus DX253]
MSATESRHEVSDLVDSFVGLEIEDPLRVTVADVDIDCHVHDIDRTNDRFTILVKTFAGDYLRVETQWAGGWLDPQVDRLKPVAEERQPLGKLQDVKAV